ncbi:15685_t:CDS:2, partial [Acaulospora morrowiae]
MAILLLRYDVSQRYQARLLRIPMAKRNDRREISKVETKCKKEKDSVGWGLGPNLARAKGRRQELKVEKTSYWNSRMSEETPFQNNFDDLLHKPTSNTISETLSNVDVSNPFKDAISPLFAP